MAKKNKQKQAEPSLSHMMHIRVSEPTKEGYEALARARSRPNQKSVGVADVAREALVEFIERKEKEIAAA